MIHHTIDTCPDDLTLLSAKLDSLSRAGARIISVMWQPGRVAEEDQAAALDASGSFVIVAQSEAAEILSMVDQPHEIPADEAALAHTTTG